MAIICGICGKKQSGWIEDYQFSLESDERICFSCNQMWEKIKHANCLGDVASEIDKIKELADHNSAINIDVKKILDGVFDSQNGEKNFSIIEKERKQAEERASEQREIKKANYAKSFNEFYEYDVVTIINEDHGTVDKEKMKQILSEHAKAGWKLHTMYSNELGKNALAVLGFGVNATACEDVLIFERRVEKIE